ncbi:MAG: hypothetical protein KC620_16665 [Myxococcales bacterium]|nr:hypothetical protein [Myxococcales bacterium]
MLWIQTGGCSGDTMSLLNAESPDLLEALRGLELELLWHPSLSLLGPAGLGRMIDRIERGEQALTILVVEGAIAQGPAGTGLYDTMLGEPKRDIVARLADVASVVVAAGTCAAYGGISAAGPDPDDYVGLQWTGDQPRGLLSPDWISRAGLPVINVAGCPTHPDDVLHALRLVVYGGTIELDAVNRPVERFEKAFHRACPAKIPKLAGAEIEPGEIPCSFELGCQGPKTAARCSHGIWLGESSKPRVGAPCVGCTSPTFPEDRELLAPDLDFVADAPPLGVSMADHRAYGGMVRYTMRRITAGLVAITEPRARRTQGLAPVRPRA